MVKLCISLKNLKNKGKYVFLLYHVFQLVVYVLAVGGPHQVVLGALKLIY